MNAKELFHQDGKTSTIWYCGKCRVVKRTKDEAEECCGPHICPKCGADTGNFFTCQICYQAAQLKIERDRFAAAEKVSGEQYGGRVFSDGHGGNEGFHETLDELMDYFENEGLTQDIMPEYCWAVHESPLVTVSVGDVTEGLADNAWDGFDPRSLNGLVELDTALRAFNDANQDQILYAPDYSKAILIPKKEVAK